MEEVENLEVKMYGGVYVKEKIIGRGCSATVFLAKAKQTQTEDDEYFQSFLPPIMAVKSTPFCDVDDLLQEQEIFSKLNGCPQILQFYGESLNIENTKEIYNLWLEFAPGGCLSDRIKKQRKNSSGGCGGLPEIEVRHYTHSILLGLKHIHECGYVHCDLKPQNILICENDIAKIADFGLSVKIHQEKDKFSVRGSPLYIAPEAIFSESYETISDIWGLGCIVLEMLSGKPPWKFAPKTEVCDALTFIAASKELPLVPTNLSSLALDFLRKCLVRDTRLRWTPDMLLRHPFVNFVEEAFTEASRIPSSESESESGFDLSRPNLPSFGSKEEFQRASIKAASLVGAKRKRTMGDEAEELAEPIGSTTITIKEDESYQCDNQFQQRYWCVRRCSMAEAKSMDDVPFGF